MSKGEITRRRIIAEAAPLFNQKGLAGCSMQNIMDATGLEKGGLYRHFMSKEDLAVECLKYSLLLAFKTRTGDVTHIEHSLDKLRYLIDRFISVPSPIKGGCPLMNAAIESDDGNPELRKLARNALRDWKGRLVQVIEEGIERNEIHRTTNPQRLANLIISLLEGSLLISRLEESCAARDDARAALHFLLDSVATGPQAVTHANRSLA